MWTRGTKAQTRAAVLAMMAGGAWSPAALAYAAWALEPPAEPPEAAPAPTRPMFQPFRYDEDWSPLADDALRTEPLDDLKYIELDRDASIWLSLGGEARTRYEYFGEPGFGLRGLSRDDFVLQRLLLHADLHVGTHFRVFAQAISAWQLGTEGSRSTVQDDRLDVQQAFADVLLGEHGDESVRLRAGRMEMSFGSSRLVSSREPANVRLNFDGVRATLKAGDATVDAFCSRPVEQRLGVFNDGENDAQTFWGVYASMPLDGPALGVDVYYLGLNRENARFDSGVATDERHSVGARLWGRAHGFDYDVEGVFQFGRFGEKDIRAWTVASNVGYTWKDAAWKPRLGLKANIASGDTDARDSTQGTFYALFSRQGYFSEINLLAPSNFFDVHPAFQVRLREDLTATLSWDPFWKFSKDDAIYSPRGIAIASGRGAGRYVGSTLDVQLEWQAGPQVSVTGFYAHFFPGEAVSSAGGRASDFFGAWLTFKF